MPQVSYGTKLRSIRVSMGLSQLQLGNMLSLSDSTINKFENYPTAKFAPGIMNSILSFIDKHSRFISAFHNKFIKGKRYAIKPTRKETSGNVESDYVFVYLRKDGKHHVFREASGGWTRTYTDVQLIGKNIQELETS